MTKLLIGTTNKAKFGEASAVLQTEGLEILGLRDFPDIKQVEENGETFEENALLKAKGYFEQTNIPCLADDGGLAIDYLNGAPGVHSHRWLGHEATDEELVHAVLARLAGVPKEKRTARLGGIVTFYDGTHTLKQENWIEGYIGEEILCEIQPGFPYRSLLFIPQFNKAYGLLTHEEHEQINFRIRNLRALKPQIVEILQQNVH